MGKQLLILLLPLFISLQAPAIGLKHKAEITLFTSLAVGVFLVHTGLQSSPECNKPASAVCLFGSVLLGAGIGWLASGTYAAIVLLKQSKN